MSDDEQIHDIFKRIDLNKNGHITKEEIEKFFLKMNNILGERYGEDDVIAFFNILDTNKDDKISYDEFKKAYM